ncbi:multidrug transporter [Bacillus sp. UMB0728]|nr:multidrug transporter [Bacillus sp. UMB0728]
MIGVEGTKTPVGNSGKAETPQRASARRLKLRPTEREVPATQINTPYKSRNNLQE